MYSIIIALVLALSTVMPVNEMPDTISLKFERKVVQNNSTEIVKGIAYYSSPQRVFIEVQQPLKQIMIVEKNVLTIYYPAENKAFRIKSKGPIPMPFIQAILSAMKDDYGLTEMGYNLAKHEKKGNILYTYWDPPKEHKKELGRFILGTENGLLNYAEALDPKGETIIKSFYGKHAEFNGKHFPLEARSEIFEGSKKNEEYVTYSEVKFNVPLPKEVINFRIPDSVPVKKIEW
jgi:outer membrane lipoprotein-sorting protein